jgi:hypothetical protein
MYNEITTDIFTQSPHVAVLMQHLLEIAKHIKTQKRKYGYDLSRTLDEIRQVISLIKMEFHFTGR